MTISIDQVVVFDTNLDARELRLHRAGLAIESGVVPGSPVLKSAGDRLECLEILRGLDDDTARQVPRTLLLSDMVDEQHQGDVGNIGARLLRTVATEPELRDNVVRVLLTQFDHPTVIADSSRYAHAFVWFDHHDRRATQLIDAIAALFADGWPDTFRHVTSRDMTVKEFEDRWREQLQGLLRAGRQLKSNDNLAAASILRGSPDKTTNQVLKSARDAAPPAARREFCESVDEFLDRMKGGKRDARAAVRDALARMSQVGIATPLSPDMIDRARRLMDDYRRHAELRYLTGLTSAEDDLARTAVALYEEHHDRLVKPGTRNNEMLRKAALDEMSNDPRLDAEFARPELAACAESEPRRTETLSYVIGTYTDTARSLLARVQR